MHKNKNCPNAKFSEISVYGKLEIIRLALGHMLVLLGYRVTDLVFLFFVD